MALLAVAAPGVELGSGAAGAGGGGLDAAGVDAGAGEQAAVGFAEVDGGGDEVRVPFREDFPEQNTHFGTDLEAAGSDGGSEGGDEARGQGTEADGEGADGFSGDIGEGAAPTGMDGGDGAAVGVGEEDGDAVGGFDGEAETWGGGDEGVAFKFLIPFIGGDDARRVDLFEGEEAGGGHGGGGSEGVVEPRLGFEQGRAVKLVGVAAEDHATGFWTWATMTWRLNSSSMASSRRTSVGRCWRLIWSILSWSLSSP